jgi:pilus assembly protein FimV
VTVAATEPQTVTQAELDAATPAAPTTSDAKADTASDTAATTAKEVSSSRVVGRGDTLAQIAAQIRPADAKIEQVLIALQRLNPAALVGDNINRIKSGSVLTLPDADTIKAIDPRDARKLVYAQTTDFNRYRSQLAQQARSSAVTAENASPDNNRSSSGKIGVQVREQGSNKASQDKLRLSAAGVTGDASGAASDVSSLDKIANDKALSEANARVAELEKNVQDMQQLLELKNKTLAEMQNRASSAEAVAQPAESAAALPVPTATAPSVKTEQGYMDQLIASFAAITLLAQDPSFMMAGGVVLVLLLVFILVRARRRARNDLSAVKDNLKKTAAGSQSIFGAAGGRNIDTSNSVFHSNFVPSVSQLDTNEVDAVAEADVYVAYGRDEQAEEILIEALRVHPERNALRVKLLEIYARLQDKQKFNRLAVELQQLTRVSSDEWQQALKMGQILDPANSLYQPSDLPSSGMIFGNAQSRTQDQRIEPSLKLVVNDPPAAKQSDILDFDSKLEGMLAAQKRDTIGGNPSRSGALQIHSSEFALTVLNDAFPTAKPTSDEHALHALRTKFDLALACQEIGDSIGARELLSEVANAQHPELAKRAQSLLSQLA